MYEYNGIQQHFHMCGRLAVNSISIVHAYIHRAYWCIIFVMRISIVAPINFTSPCNIAQRESGENLTNLTGDHP